MTVLFDSVDALLAHARQSLERLTPAQALARRGEGALIVDIRPEWQRAVDGEIPDAVIVERNHLEWRLHPRSKARISHAEHGQAWIVVCTEGYTSSLAAASLRSLGIDATDVVGGVYAWRASGYPMIDGPSPLTH
jgi:rhodanese-related sulfurtransferase